VTLLQFSWKALSLGLATCLAAAPALAQQAARPTTAIQVPTEAQLAAFPNMTGFRLSPDGKHMLAIESKGDQRTIVVWKTAALSERPTVIGATNMQIQSASFLKNDVLGVFLRQPYDSRLGDRVIKTFIDKLMVTDLEGKRWREPLESSNLGLGETSRRVKALAVPTVLSTMPNDPDHVIMEGDSVGSDRDVFSYNVRTGVATRILRLGEKDSGVFVDTQGRVRAKIRSDIDSKGAFIATEIRNNANSTWEEHFRSYVKDRDVVQAVGLGLNDNTLILSSNVGRETTALYEYDPAQRKKVSTVFEHRFFDATGVRRVGRGDGAAAGPIDGFYFDGVFEGEIYYDNPQFDAVVKGMARALGLTETNVTLTEVATGKQAETKMLNGAAVRILDYRAGDVPVYLIVVSGQTYPTEYYLLRGQQLTLLSRAYPQIDRRALGSAKFVYYKARDGLNIPGYLVTPNPQLCGPGPYAAVVHPHGGPWARDSMDFDSSGWVPMMVSRCQVVLMPQFRGSSGWGRALWRAGDAEWGQKMQDDKDDGAKWLISEKLADPKRIAMFGFSYGGYSAMAAAVRPNDLYKCAIAGAGVSDITKIIADFYTNPFFRESQEPTIRGLSPALQADKIQIPIMVYHGERDQIVPLVQSEMFVDKARQSKQKVDYHVLNDYAHGPAWTREIMTRQLRLISDYFKTGCGGGGL
jgi:acetyl esterase/lipase